MALAHSMVPHCEDLFCSANAENHHHHEHHKHSQEDIHHDDTHHHFQHEGHFDHGFLELIICMISDLDHAPSHNHVYSQGTSEKTITKKPQIDLAVFLAVLMLPAEDAEQASMSPDSQFSAVESPVYDTGPQRGPPAPSNS